MNLVERILKIVGISDWSPVCKCLWNENQFITLLFENQLGHVHCLE